MEDPRQHESYRALEAAVNEAEALRQASRENFAARLAELQRGIQGLLSAVEAQKEEVDSSGQGMRQALEQFASEVAESLQRDSEASGRVATLEHDLEEAASQRQELTGRVEELEHRLADEQTAAQAAREQVARLHQDFEQARLAADAARDDLAEKAQWLDEARAACEAAERRIEQEQQAAADSARELETLREAHAALRQDLAAREEALEQARSQAGEHEREVERLRDEVGELQPLREEVEAARERMAALEQERDAALQARRELEEQVEALRNDPESERVRDELVGLREAHAALVERVRREETEFRKSVLAQELAKALHEAEEAQREAARLRAQLDERGASEAAAAAPTPFAEPPVGDGAAPPPREDVAARIREAAQTGVGAKRSIGDILCEAGVVSREAVEEAAEEQKLRPQQHLGAILVERNLAPEDTVAQALACQSEVDFVRIEPGRVSPDAAALVSKRLAQQHRCIPLEADEDRLVLALSNPMDLLAIEDVERATGRKVDVVVATVREIERAIAQHYA